MAYLQPGGASFQQAQPFIDATQFDIFEWHPNFQSCVRYFLDHAQYDVAVQALAAFVNIRLPFQKPNPVLSSRSASSPPPPAAGPSHPGVRTAASSSSGLPRGVGGGGAGVGGGLPAGGTSLPVHPPHHHHQSPSPQLLPQLPPHVTLIPYIRRLVATGFDFGPVLHGFFGDDWLMGVGRLHEQERRNYLFAAKSDTWLTVKAAYDMGEEQSIPFLRPLRDVSEEEIVGAEVSWSEWLAMQDWMLGPRDPAEAQAQGGPGGGGKQHGGGGSNTGHGRVRVKHEEE